MERKSVSQILTSRDEATEALKAILKALEIEESKTAPVYKTFDELFDAYLEIIRPTVREQTYYLYERLVKTYLRDEFGSRHVNSLDVLKIERFYVKLQKKLSAETIFKVHTQFKRALKKAKTWKWVTDNPIDEVKPPKRSRAAKETLTVDELNTFFAACPNTSIKTQWMFFALPGARPQEVFAARWQDIDFERKTFTIR